MTKSEKRGVEPVVLLVDSKVRDLDVAALIQSNLQSLGINCYLEPLEAFRAVLAAYRPGMIIFNHLTASHLVAWSKRLAAMGVLTAVLPNEGIAYDLEDLRFLAGKFHGDAHIDYVFSWNEPYRSVVLDEMKGGATKVEVVGIPRFDFYFGPWSRLLDKPQVPRSERPRILLCTNFQVARFWELPREHGDRFFAPWTGRIPLYNDYWRAIEAHWRARKRVLEYLETLLDAGRFDVVLRPHPREDPNYYRVWMQSLNESQESRLWFDPASPISSLINDCDLEISCETCTTAMESWIANKPTIELIFERDPLWYREEHARCNVECHDPRELPQIVDRELADPMQPAKRELRRAHLEKWCSSPDGTSSLRLARIVANALREKQNANWSKLTVNDFRRAAKLAMFRKLGRAYHYDPLLSVKNALFRERYAGRHYAYQKSITPSDVASVQRRFQLLRKTFTVMNPAD